MNLVLLGPPGCGKGTQAGRLANAYQIPAISTGDILRAQRFGGTRVGEQVRRSMDRGELVPDHVVIEIIGHRLDEPDTRPGFILDGFPRTVAQAEALDTLLAELGRPIDAVVDLEIGRQALIDRLGHRYVCPVCNSVYSLTAEAVRRSTRCAQDGAALYQRSDDRPEIIAHRIDVYLEQTAPLINYYRRQGNLLSIDGDRTADEVYASITRRLTGAKTS